jgi:hypothetical protein
MFWSQQLTASQRRGIILLVVLALLTLFAIVGISFVLYANSQATGSRYFREAENPATPDMDPELLLSYFLGQLVYDVDDVNGVYSAMRGHSVGRNAYGLNGVITQPGTPGATFTPADNTLPFSGVGRFHMTTTPHGPADPENAFGGVDEYYLVNYTHYLRLNEPLRDPERLAPDQGNPRRPNRLANYWLESQPPMGGTTKKSYIPFNPTYTYPDLNSMFLAAVRADGAVLAHSFHRYPRTAHAQGTYFGPLGPQNDNWYKRGPTNAYLKYLVMRPRPVDQLLDSETWPPTNRPYFPAPEDDGGDVKNLPGPGFLVDPNNNTYANNDSFWMDLGAPVMIAQDGTKYKPLFAPLIVDLDGRINVNVHGNIRGQGGMHAGNQGWGPWEVNVSSVFNDPNQPNEWANLFHGDAGLQIPGRYGYDQRPHYTQANNTADPGDTPRYYAPVDFDGRKSAAMGGGRTDPVKVPGNPYQFQFGGTVNSNDWCVSAFPGPPPVPPSTPPNQPYAPPVGYDNGNLEERTDHPLLFNYFNPQRWNGNQFDGTFAVSNMEALLRYADTGSPALTSDLFRLCSYNFGGDPMASSQEQANAIRRRNMITTHSFTLDRPALTPWVWNPAQAPYQMRANHVYPGYPGNAAGPIPFPDLANRNATPYPVGSEFQPEDWRAYTAALQKVNLNRYLTRYPENADGTPKLFYTAADMPRFNQAQSDRQQLALDIYHRFVLATGAFNPWLSTQDPTVDDLRALRWLAQLSVNIVDYIDYDDIMTPFNWASYGTPNFQTKANMLSDAPAGYGFKGWVFGTEVPRLVINEFYMEARRWPPGHENDPQPENTFDHRVSVWVELHNPFQKDAPNADPLQGVAYLQIPTGAGAPNYSPYELVIARHFEIQPGVPALDPAPTGQSAWNVTGDPNPADAANTQTINQWGANPSRIVPPSEGRYANSDPSKHLGYYLLGPGPLVKPNSTPQPPDPPLPDLDLTAPGMQYDVPKTQGLPDDVANRRTLLLRRLACPYLPPSSSNPYITVDYVDSQAGIGMPTGGQIVWKADTNGGGIGGTSGLEQRTSYGKQQPYVAAPGFWQYQRPIKPGTASGTLKNQPQHTFLRGNGRQPAGTQPTTGGTLGIPFRWLTHLDRQLVSPMELLQVSAFKPHELTQKFETTTGGGFYQHLAPWFDQQARIYRGLEMLETGNRMTGTAYGGRIPGAVNINTIWDLEILQALADAPDKPPALAYNPFTKDDVTNIFTTFMNLRTPNKVPDVNDRPFRSLGTGYSRVGGDAQHQARGIGINDGFARSQLANADQQPGGGWQPGPYNLTRLFQTPGGNNHPYMQAELMAKLFNNVTTRSNVFAVFVTVGFFRVLDDTTFPVRLGEEIGKAENRHVRHRMFAVVDRSNLSIGRDQNTGQILYGTPADRPPILLQGKLFNPQPGVSGANRRYTIPGATLAGGTLTGKYEGYDWQLKDAQGATDALTGRVIIDYGRKPIPAAGGTVFAQQMEDLVKVGDIRQVQPTEPPTFQLGLNPNNAYHDASFLITLPNSLLGNPGPTQRFNPRQYPWLVRYFSIIN